MKILIISILLLTLFNDCFSQEEEELAKKAQNPVGDLISIPFQNNTAFGIGSFDRTLNVLNIQPVYPIHMTEKWNLITRTILPIISQPDVTMENGGTTGIGDINFTVFLSPKAPNKIIWGIGPSILLPTASKDELGTGKWAIGPSLVVLTMMGHWVTGLLVNNVWSFAGDSDRADVNSMLLQPFVNYNMKNGWYLTSSPIITVNWKASSGNQWVIPLGGGVGKIVRFGKLPINMNTQAFSNVVTPEGGPTWSFRFQLQLMFPK